MNGSDDPSRSSSIFSSWAFGPRSSTTNVIGSLAVARCGDPLAACGSSWNGRKWPRRYSRRRRLRRRRWVRGQADCANLESPETYLAAGRPALDFHGRDVNLVMGPRERGAAVPFRVLVDGAPPGDSHGLDVDKQGHGTVDEQRLYQLIRQPGPIGDGTFEIAFLEPGVEAYVFTFG